MGKELGQSSVLLCYVIGPGFCPRAHVTKLGMAVPACNTIAGRLDTGRSLGLPTGQLSLCGKFQVNKRSCLKRSQGRWCLGNGSPKLTSDLHTHTFVLSCAHVLIYKHKPRYTKDSKNQFLAHSFIKVAGGAGLAQWSRPTGLHCTASALCWSSNQVLLYYSGICKSYRCLVNETEVCFVLPQHNTGARLVYCETEFISHCWKLKCPRWNGPHPIQ